MTSFQMVRYKIAFTGSIQRVGSLLLILVGIGLVYFTFDASRFQAIFFP